PVTGCRSVLPHEASAQLSTATIPNKRRVANRLAMLTTKLQPEWPHDSGRVLRGRANRERSDNGDQTTAIGQRAIEQRIGSEKLMRVAYPLAWKKSPRYRERYEKESGSPHCAAHSGVSLKRLGQ